MKAALRHVMYASTAQQVHVVRLLRPVLQPYATHPFELSRVVRDQRRFLSQRVTGDPQIIDPEET